MDGKTNLASYSFCTFLAKNNGELFDTNRDRQTGRQAVVVSTVFVCFLQWKLHKTSMQLKTYLQPKSNRVNCVSSGPIDRDQNSCAQTM